MITVTITGVSEVQQMLEAFPKEAGRALEISLDYTAKFIKSDVQRAMLTVFDKPTPYTMNSLQVTPTKGHNMQASVWFKEPARMGDHYLVPQVEGGSRKLKGFERSFGKEFVPGAGARIDQYGNVRGGDIVQIMSVLGKLGRYAGDNANITAKSRKRNTKERDYVYLPHGSGKLPPGIYKRVQTGRGFGAKTKRTFADQSRTYQRGRTRNGISSVVRARGLQPILIVGRTGHDVKSLLDFYGIANATIDRELVRKFWQTFNRVMP